MQIPTKEQVSQVSEELRARSQLPPHILKVLDALPQNTHPMTQLSTAVMALQVFLPTLECIYLNAVIRRSLTLLRVLQLKCTFQVSSLCNTRKY